MVIYANNAGTSWPKAPPVVEAVARTMRAEPCEYSAIFQNARGRIATRFGVAQPERLLLTPGCTSALAAVLLALPWEPGEVVVTSALEHEAMLRPVRTLVRLRGIEHYEVPRSASGPFDLAALDRRLDEGRVRAVAVTAASNVTGERLPVEDIVGRTRGAGVFAVIDAAQTAGLLDVQFDQLGAHAMAFAGHKGPLAPVGIGALALAADLKLDAAPGFCDVGSVDLPGAAALAESLEWIDAFARPQTHPVRLRERLAASLRGREGFTVFGGPGEHTGTVSFLHPRLPLERAEEFFGRRDIVVRAGRHCAPHALATLGVPDGTIRVSFGRLNEDSDVDAILEALEAMPP